MQNKEKCLHATPLSETALILTIQIREGRKSKEKEEMKEGGKETKRERAGWKGRARVGGKVAGGGAGRKEGRDSTLKRMVLDL